MDDGVKPPDPRAPGRAPYSGVVELYVGDFWDGPLLPEFKAAMAAEVASCDEDSLDVIAGRSGLVIGCWGYAFAAAFRADWPA